MKRTTEQEQAASAPRVLSELFKSADVINIIADPANPRSAEELGQVADRLNALPPEVRSRVRTALNIAQKSMHEVWTPTRRQAAARISEVILVPEKSTSAGDGPQTGYRRRRKPKEGRLNNVSNKGPFYSEVVRRTKLGEDPGTIAAALKIERTKVYATRARAVRDGELDLDKLIADGKLAVRKPSRARSIMIDDAIILRRRGGQSAKEVAAAVNLSIKTLRRRESALKARGVSLETTESGIINLKIAELAMAGEARGDIAAAVGLTSVAAVKNREQYLRERGFIDGDAVLQRRKERAMAQAAPRVAELAELDRQIIEMALAGELPREIGRKVGLIGDKAGRRINALIADGVINGELVEQARQRRREQIDAQIVELSYAGEGSTAIAQHIGIEEVTRSVVYARRKALIDEGVIDPELVQQGIEAKRERLEARIIEFTHAGYGSTSIARILKNIDPSTVNAMKKRLIEEGRIQIRSDQTETVAVVEVGNQNPGAEVVAESVKGEETTVFSGSTHGNGQQTFLGDVLGANDLLGTTDDVPLADRNRMRRTELPEKNRYKGK